MTRVALLLLAVLACRCTAIKACNTAFQAASQFVAPTIKLNTQSACSGYSTANGDSDPNNTNAVDLAAPACDPDPSDTPCGALVRSACCDTFATGCAGLNPAACAAVPSFHGCVLGAVDDNPSTCRGS